MKKALLMACAALVALVSCENQSLDTDRVPVTFHLQATLPVGAETKAVKEGWEDGDIIFVVFSGVESPGYLKMTYDNGTWIEKQMNDVNECALPLNEHDKGTMTAIFQPFAKDYTFLYDSGDTFAFSEIFISYYLTAQLPYEVIDGEVSGMFDMKIPDGFVQFYIEADDAAEGKAMLWEPHIRPCATTGVDADGVTVNYIEFDKGKPVPGFAYKGGYVFSGMLDSEAQDNPVTYTFTRFMGTGNVETATTVTPHTMKPSGKTGRAANITELAWSEQDVREAVDLGLPSRNKWANVNLGAALPTDYGAYYAWGELYPKVTYWWNNYKWGGSSKDKVSKYCQTDKSNYWDGAGDPDNLTVLQSADDAAIACWGDSWQIPSKEDWNELINECSWTWIDSYSGTAVNGYLVENNNASIFLPAAGYVYDFGCSDSENYNGYYWTTSIDSNPLIGNVFYFYPSEPVPGYTILFVDRYSGSPIRPVWKEE